MNHCATLAYLHLLDVRGAALCSRSKASLIDHRHNSHAQSNRIYVNHAGDMPERWYTRNLQAIISSAPLGSSVPAFLYVCLAAAGVMAVCAMVAAGAFKLFKLDPRAPSTHAETSAGHHTVVPLLQPQRSIDSTMMWHA